MARGDERKLDAMSWVERLTYLKKVGEAPVLELRAGILRFPPHDSSVGVGHLPKKRPHVTFLRFFRGKAARVKILSHLAT